MRTRMILPLVVFVAVLVMVSFAPGLPAQEPAEGQDVAMDPTAALPPAVGELVHEEVEASATEVREVVTTYVVRLTDHRRMTIKTRDGAFSEMSVKVPYERLPEPVQKVVDDEEGRNVKTFTATKTLKHFEGQTREAYRIRWYSPRSQFNMSISRDGSIANMSRSGLALADLPEAAQARVQALSGGAKILSVTKTITRGQTNYMIHLEGPDGRFRIKVDDKGIGQVVGKQATQGQAQPEELP